ncbi:MAG: hypothetical protein ACJ8FS_09005 [Sphingomicrobium sp.]
MSLDDTLRALLAEAGKPARLREARAAWVRRTAAAWREAQRRMDERCDEALDRLSEEEFERLCDEEEAKVDAFRAPLKAVAERDLWPKALYWGGI